MLVASLLVLNALSSLLKSLDKLFSLELPLYIFCKNSEDIWVLVEMRKILENGMLGLLLMGMIILAPSIAEAQSDSFLIDCGTNSSVNIDGRRWVGDMVPNKNVTFGVPGVVASATTSSGSSIHDSIYRTARIFSSPLNYTVKVIQGAYIMRLHFYPFNFDKYNANESSFSVLANGLKLMSEFSVPREIMDRRISLQNPASNSSSSPLVKEYILIIKRDVLVVEFVPARDSFGFINAIEIVQVGNEIFAGTVSKVGGNSANLDFSEMGLETMYRLNVGGPEIKPSEDPGFWRSWRTDSSYMLTENAGSEIFSKSNITYVSMNDSLVAPLTVYETARAMSNTEVLEKRFNMSWKFEVDPDFDYLIRLHFCELIYNKSNERIFRIYINNRTAADNFDIFVRAGGKNKAYHQDYFDAISSKIDRLWVQLGPDTTTGAAGTDALLNGLEIFKLSRNGNLAYVEKYDSTSNAAGKSKTRILWIGIGAGVASVAILAIIVALIARLCKNQRARSSNKKKNWTWRALFLHGTTVSSNSNAKGAAGTQTAYGSVMSSRHGKRFTLAEVRAATKNFDESLIIGVGGFGKVYKGEIDDGMLVAIKRANPQSEQGLSEFETEIEMLSKLRHRHLVSLIGYCEEQNEMILVYEYMANGTLRSHLFGSELPPLSWKQRVEACIGAARGLHYLHTGAERGIIHRDVKTTNILLDENFIAKMSDFGLSKTGPALDHTHVSTAVKGSFGYLDPEYFRRQQLTDKSDVYSFGVVLFEVACARAVINPSLPKDQINLAEWAKRWQQQKSLESIIDPRLKNSYCHESLSKFGEIAEKCIGDIGKSRPTMGEVLWHLEYVLQLHEAWLRSQNTENSFSKSESLQDSEDGGRVDLQQPISSPDETAVHLETEMEDETANRGIKSKREAAS